MTDPLVLDEEFAARLMGELSSEVAGDKDKAVSLYWEYQQSAAAKKRLAEWAEQEPGDDVLEKTRRDFLPGLLHVEKLFTQMPRQWPGVFERKLTTLDVERSVELRRLGLPQLCPRGGETARDNAPGERFVYMLEPNDIALGTALKADPEVPSFIAEALPPRMLGMADSFNQAEEILHANVLNAGRAYNPQICGDGVPLFSDNHPIDPKPPNNSYSNRCDKNLNECTLEQIAPLIRALPDQAGLRMFARPRKLVVPIQYEFAASRLIKAVQESVPGTYPEGYCVLDFLDPKAWFVLTTIKGLVSFEKQPFRLDLKIEGDKIVLEGSQSYACGYYNPRAVFGCFPE